MGSDSLINKSNMLRHSLYWFLASVFLFLELSVFDGFFLCWLMGQIFPHALTYTMEVAILCIALANALYCLISYFACLYSNVKTQLFSGSISSSSADRSTSSMDTSRADCVQSLCAFMGNFFKQPPISQKEQLSNSLSSTFSEMDAQNSSLSSLVGYHDSLLNRTVSSVHSRSQLDDILQNDTCDSVIDSIDCTSYFNYEFPDVGRMYQPGTAQYLLPEENAALNGIKSFIDEHQLAKFARRPDKRIFRRSRSDSAPEIHIETDLKTILNIYELNERDMELHEIKLRIWLCNTLIKPMLEKIKEINDELDVKYSALHLRIGSSSLETVQNALLHKPELCNTLIPFVLPYLRIHQNQQYIVNRMQTLARNIALEEFKWNGGGDQTIRDENNSFNRTICWNEQMPTDTELLWHFFCIYMDFHLSPSSDAISAITEFNKPFTNVFFVKVNNGKLPLAHVRDAFPSSQQQTHDGELAGKYFIRMISNRPPIFELVVDGGETIILPSKDEPQNFWHVLILFLAHVKKMSQSRIGHIHISSLSLDIFDA